MVLIRSCLIPGCPTRREVPSDAYACPDCQLRLVRKLGEIETYLDIVSPVPSRSGDFSPRRPGYGSRPPLRLDVVAMLDPRTEINGTSGAVYADGEDDRLDEIPNIGADLGGWVRVLYEEHPDWAGTEWDGEVIAYADGAALLRSRCDWICRQPWVDEFAEGIFRVHGTLGMTVKDLPEKAYGQCIKVGCEGLVYRRSTDPTDPRLKCRTCSTTFDGLDLVRIRSES
jgi:hypothetical protein